MKSVTGVFQSRSDAVRAFTGMRSTGVSEDRIALLTPESSVAKLQSVPTVAAEQPGMGKAIGAVLGGTAALSGIPLIAAIMLPGVGVVTALGLLGGAILTAAGASAGAIAGGKLENS